MKMNPQKLRNLIKQASSQLFATSRKVLRRIDPVFPQDATDLYNYN